MCSSLYSLDFTIFYHGLQQEIFTFSGIFTKIFLFILRSALRYRFERRFCLFEHRLGENPIASGGVIDQNMGHSTHEAPILEDGTSAHALHDAAGRRQKRRVGHPDDQIPARVGVADPLDLDAVSAGRFPSMVAHISAGPVTTSCANAISRNWPEKWVRVVP